MTGSWWSAGTSTTSATIKPISVGRPGEPELDPNGDCQRRQGIAAYSFGGQLDPNWSPAYSGSYSLVWQLHTEGLRLHTGGEFKRVSGVTQNSYARLSPASIKGTIKGDDRVNTLAGTPDADTIYGYGGADRIGAWGGGGSDEGRGGVETTISLRWTGVRTTSSVVLVRIAPEPTPGTRSQGV
jgi:hypothetical protein